MSNHDGATIQLLAYLEKNGATAIKELEKTVFFKSVRSRVPELVKQGRIERVKVFNPDSGKKGERLTLAGLKFKSYDFTKKKRPSYSRSSEVKEKISVTLKRIRKKVS